MTDTNKERAEFEAWYASQPDATAEPERSYELDEAGMNDLTKDCIWEGWQARAAKAPAAPTHAAQRDELLQAAIDFIGTLTGMTPPPIEVAPPEVFAPFYEFVDRVQAITGAAPPAPTEQWRDIETAPKTRKARLVWCPEYRNIYEVTWCEHKIAWIHFGHGDVMTDTATHWRDLPAPPQGAANKDES